MEDRIIREYFRHEMLPHIWCPGCGNGTLTHDIASAIDASGIDRNKTVIVSGIGCSSRASGYLDFDTMHTTHGRAIPVATGIKMAKPELNVIVITGDGDCTAIGGNHFIHGCRRNIDLTVVLFNNNIYGMTGGQYSPTTPTGAYGTTAPYGNIDQDFDVCSLAEAAGASYIARGDVYHVDRTVRLIKDGILHKGFSLIECVASCPMYFGRKNKRGGAVDMIRWQKDNAVDIAAAEKLPKEALEGKYIIGKLCEKEAPEYTGEYQKIIDRLAQEAGK